MTIIDWKDNRHQSMKIDHVKLKETKFFIILTFFKFIEGNASLHGIYILKLLEILLDVSKPNTRILEKERMLNNDTC